MRELQDFAAFCANLLDNTSAIVRSSYRTDFTIEVKSDGTPVTSIDRAVEAALRDGIAECYPDHGIIGEEQEPRPANSPWTWVIDPIDGTKAWIAGRPTFTTLVALCHSGEPVLGFIDQPITGERWIGGRDTRTRLNGVDARCRKVARMNQAITACNNPLRALRHLGSRFQRLLDGSSLCISGGDSYLIGLLALGKVDVVIETGLTLVDYCALVPVVEGAGGVVSDLRGQPLRMSSDGTFLAAATAALHQEALGLVAATGELDGPVATSTAGKRSPH